MNFVGSLNSITMNSGSAPAAWRGLKIQSNENVLTEAMPIEHRADAPDSIVRIALRQMPFYDGSSN